MKKLKAYSGWWENDEPPAMTRPAVYQRPGKINIEIFDTQVLFTLFQIRGHNLFLMKPLSDEKKKKAFGSVMVSRQLIDKCSPLNVFGTCPASGETVTSPSTTSAKSK